MTAEQAVRVGIIGLGVMGTYLVRTVQDTVCGAEIVARSSLPGPDLTHTNPLDLINDSNVDAVIVATPDETHEEFVLACLAANKPVFCEKPLAPDAAACRRILDAEVALGHRLVQVGYMRRYDPAYEALKRALDERIAGSPLVLHCSHRAQGPSRNRTTDLLMSNAAVHDIDAARWLFSQDIVGACVYMPSAVRVAHNKFDPMVIILRTEQGILIDLELFVNVGYGCEVLAEAVCESGTIALRASHETVIKAAGRSASPVAQSTFTRFSTAYRLEIQTWVDAIRNAQSSTPGVWDGYAATAVADACRESIATGHVAKVQMEARPSLYA